MSTSTAAIDAQTLYTAPGHTVRIGIMDGTHAQMLYPASGQSMHACEPHPLTRCGCGAECDHVSVGVSLAELARRLGSLQRPHPQLKVVAWRWERRGGDRG
jgi:hypothetical protein